ncbi:alpha/beta hydrolase-fold protein [Psychrosphaera algicola]|uniref:Alpha/beta hydrolase-fold protein n=1 Tax=Psychrosphaera algicola TaxID=3023714 RepID=A0ABT5FEY8_9GAMM|nr:alpha/beta hydrolase-fold protein [Psychrosphaera sp. G1-22]MDC2889901.1 alpha/beta hydrolase-fold protein [Psychrosphaera sp. G1-22]
MKFITQTLKPLIDDKYRTQAGKKTTGIAGSSLGGLMAIYSALNYSNIFGYIGAFSPSLGIENEEGVNVLFQAIEQVNQIDDVVIYTDMGLGEYGDYAKFDKLTQLLNAKLTNGASLTTVKDDLGRHCEASWSERFPRLASQFSKN